MLIQILTHTPPWVFALFFGLTYIGYLHSKPRLVPGARLAVLPAAMAFLSLMGILSSYGPNPAAWAAMALAIALCGAGLPPAQGVSFCLRSRRFSVPDSWIPLALMMCIFLPSMP